MKEYYRNNIRYIYLLEIVCFNCDQLNSKNFVIIKSRFCFTSQSAIPLILVMLHLVYCKLGREDMSVY